MTGVHCAPLDGTHPANEAMRRYSSVQAGSDYTKTPDRSNITAFVALASWFVAYPVPDARVMLISVGGFILIPIWGWRYAVNFMPISDVPTVIYCDLTARFGHLGCCKYRFVIKRRRRGVLSGTR